MNYADWKQMVERRDSEMRARMHEYLNAPNSVQEMIGAEGHRSFRLSAATQMKVFGPSVQLYCAMDRKDTDNGAAIVDISACVPQDLARAALIKQGVDQWIDGQSDELVKTADLTYALVGSLGGFARIAYLASTAADPKAIRTWDELSREEQTSYAVITDFVLRGEAKTAEQLHEYIRRGDPNEPPWADLTENARTIARVFVATVQALIAP